MTPEDVSVVIPALNEETGIARAIRSAFVAGAGEVIVSDGGSSDATWQSAEQAGVTKLVRSLPGRGIQLNAGALVADRKVLLFLHADNYLDSECLRQIASAGDIQWGAFRQRIDSDRTVFRMIEWGNACRVRYRRMPFGDQAMFVLKSLFRDQGGFAEIPLMEDVDLSKRLRRVSRPRLLDGPVTISSRRWDQNGPVRQTLRNWSIQLSYGLGASPESLTKRYR